MLRSDRFPIPTHPSARWVAAAPLMALVLLSGCSLAGPEPQPRPRRISEMAREVAAMPLGPSISKEQARSASRLYFWLSIGRCGWAEEPIDEGACWSSRPRVGYPGSPSPDRICIDKTTGLVSWGAGPPYENPQALAQAVLSRLSAEEAQRHGAKEK